MSTFISNSGKISKILAGWTKSRMFSSFSSSCWCIHQVVCVYFLCLFPCELSPLSSGPKKVLPRHCWYLATLFPACPEMSTEVACSAWCWRRHCAAWDACMAVFPSWCACRVPFRSEILILPVLPVECLDETIFVHLGYVVGKVRMFSWGLQLRLLRQVMPDSKHLVELA